MKDDITAEIAFQYNDSYNELVLSFANNVHTPDGGTHETGFKNALTKVLNEYGKNSIFSRTATSSWEKTSGKE